MINWTSQLRAEEEFQLVSYLINRVTGRASGRIEDRCLFDMPHDKYFIGNLRSSEGANSNQDTLLQRELMSKMAPLAFGAEFLLAPEPEQIRLKVSLSWTCYYRVFPTLDEQRRLLQYDRADKTEAFDEDNHNSENNPQESDSGDDNQETVSEGEQNKPREKEQVRGKKQKDTLCPKFKKITCLAEGEVTLNRLGGKRQVDTSVIVQACTEETNRAKLMVINDPEAVKTADDIDSRIRIQDEALESEEKFRNAINNLSTSVIPEWGWNIISNILASSQGDVLSLVFENASPMPNKSYNRESYLFDVMVSVQFQENAVKPIELELAPRGFRYDRMVWSRGFNCEIIREGETTFRSTHTPIHIQSRYESRTQPEARFDILTQDPIPTLQKILDAMQAYSAEWDSALAVYQSRFGSEWGKFEPEFLNDRKQFIAEISRFARGLELIRTDPDVNVAFRLVNETFLRAGKNPMKPKSNWRLFQIVFLVIQIPEIAALNNQNQLELSVNG